MEKDGRTDRTPNCVLNTVDMLPQLLEEFFSFSSTKSSERRQLHINLIGQIVRVDSEPKIIPPVL